MGNFPKERRRTRRLAAILLYVSVLVAASSGTASRAQETLLGVPFLKATGETDREFLRARIDKSVVKQLAEDNHNWNTYISAALHKAIAIRLDISSGFAPEVWRYQDIQLSVMSWGAAWEYTSLTDARNKALSNCNDDPDYKRSGIACIVYFEDYYAVGLNQVVDNFLKVQSEIISDETNRFKHAVRIYLVNNALSQLAGRRIAYVLSPARPITIGYPDEQQDYASACQKRIFYALRPVAQDDSDRFRSDLKRIVDAGLYGQYARSVDTASDYTVPSPHYNRRMTNQMRFAIMREGEPQIKLPSNLAAALRKERIIRVWLEGSVRTTSDGLPLAIDPFMRPLAIETNTRLYEGVEIRMPDVSWRCQISLPFSNEVLRFQVRRGDTTAAYRALDLLLGNIRNELESTPLLAAPILDEAYAPGEFGMVRNDLPSVVLGNPNYERSTYLVQTWTAGENPPFASLYRRQDYQGVGPLSLHDGPNLHLYLKVQHIFERATHRLDEYRDPSQQESEQYKQIISQDIVHAVEHTCNEINGEMNNYVCVVSTLEGTPG